MYHIFIWSFCTLASVTISYLLPDGVSNFMPVKMLEIIASIISIPVWRIYVWYQCNNKLWSFDRITILSSHVIRLIFTLPPPRKVPIWYAPYLYLANRLGYFHCYCLISFKFIGKIPSVISSVSLIYDII